MHICAVIKGKLRVTWSLRIFSEGLRLNTDAYVELVITVVKLWTTRIANGSRIRPPATPLGNVENGWRRIFATTPVPMFGLLTACIIMHGALLRKAPIAVPVLQKPS